MSSTRNLGLAAAFCCVTASLAAAAADGLLAGKPVPFAQTSGKVVGFYLDGGSIATGYTLDPVTAHDLTHLLYAFLGICGPRTDVHSAAACKPGQDFRVTVGSMIDDATLTRSFARIKAEAPAIKLLVSIGGSDGSKPFFALTRSAEAEARFIASVRDFLAAHPTVDGVDIDWEFPTDSSPADGEPQLGLPADAAAYAGLMHGLRTMLDELGGSGRRYLLTSAVSTAGHLASVIDYKDAARDTDLFFAMTYDYYGPWLQRAGHHASVLPPQDPAVGPVGIQPLLDAGIPPAKLVAGVAAYGRGWQIGPTGDLVANYNGNDGVTLYRDLAKWLGPAGRGAGGYRVEYDPALRSYSLWNPAERIYIGYDDPRAVRDKGRRAVAAGLAGVFGWELSQDDGDLLNAMNRGVGNEPRRR